MGKDLKGKELGDNISQRKDGRYVARYTDNFGKRHAIYSDKLRDLKKELNEALYDKNHNIYVKTSKFTVDEWFYIWLDTVKKGSIRNSTYSRYVAYYENNIHPHLGSMNLTDVKPIHIQNMFNIHRKEGKLSYSTLIHLKSLLNGMFEYALTNEYIIRNPSIKVGIKSTKITKSADYKKVLTISEQKTFLKYAQNSPYYSLYIFLLYTGCRIGEALALTWEDIDFNQRLISVNKTFGCSYDCRSRTVYYYINPTKTTAGTRQVPIHPTLLELLGDLRDKDCPNNTHSLAFHTCNMTHIDAKCILGNIRAISRRINKDYPNMQFGTFSPHTFRHTFATNCFLSGIDAKVVQTYLGHTSLKMTMDLYTHVVGDKKMDEIAKLVDIM